MFAIETKNLCKDFSGIGALKGVSLNIPQQVTVGLVGPNGAGKTTLFSLICDFLKPSSGEIYLLGRSIRKGIPRGILSVLPQDAKFAKYISIRALFEWYAELLGFNPAEARKEAERVLEIVDLAADSHKQGDQLSHGMHKRMGIAQAFLGTPQIILLDEPTAGLDPKNAKEIRDVIRGLHGQVTVMVSSHNLAEIEDICDYIAILDKGVLLTQQPISSFTQQQSLLSFTLTAPISLQQIAYLEQLDYIAKATFLDKSKHLQLELKGKAKEMDQHIPKIIEALSARQIHFVEMTKGSTLEDKFLDVISKKQGQ